MITLTERELADISAYVKERYGVNLAKKSTLIEGRLGHYLHTKGFESYGAYFEHAKNDPTGEEMAALIGRLTTNHTFFLRENDHFGLFVNEVLPWALSRGNTDLRVWCAGCSTGEEPYGLSIHILEALGHGAGGVDTTILASDISENSLAIAKAGVYPRENLTAIPEEWLAKYFVGIGGGAYRVAPALRANVAFKKINLMDPFTPKKPYHAIFCRNVMIYFDAEARKDLIARFHAALLPGAYLFIGHSESLTALAHDFQYQKPSVYKKP